MVRETVRDLYISFCAKKRVSWFSMPPGKDSNAEKQKVVHEKRRERD
jgi:hypothetical protein